MHRFQDAEVDSDHDLVIARFDDLCGELHWRRLAPAQLADLAEQLLNYSTVHFAREERLMAAHGYPDLPGHRQAHQGLWQAFTRVLQPLLSGVLDPEADLKALRTLFLSHIVTWDEAYAEWLDPRNPDPAPAHGPKEETMKINIRNERGITLILPQGKITLGDGDQELGEAVRTELAQGARKILLDFSAVSYLDSSGLGELVGCFTAIRSRGGDLKVCGLNTRVFDLMKLTSLHSVFDVRDTQDQALAAF